MYESFSLKIRKQLNAKIWKRSFFFIVMSPFFFILSYVFYLITNYRRNNLITEISHHPNLKIICVGNVILGGTGKSPIVQKIAENFLNQNYIVAIASRGVGKNNQQVFIHAECCDEEKLTTLSDENREHLEFLIPKNKLKNIYILQNKNRKESLTFFMNELNKINISTGSYPSAIFILDDGLQHFSCPRDINLCVWQPNILNNSPNFCLPVGPYREGFGNKSFAALLCQFDFRLWSRAKRENLPLFLSDVKNCLHKFQLNTSNKDVIINYELKVKEIIYDNSGAYEVKQFCHADDLACIEEVSLVAGIGNPNNFLIDVKHSFYNCKNWKTLFLDDHADYDIFRNKLNLFFQMGSVFIFTWKDFYRWQNEKDFQNNMRGKKIFCCSLEIEFLDIFGNPSSFLEKIAHV